MWSIDKIEDNIVVLEDIKTLEKKEVDKNLLPNNIKEGSIISNNDNIYVLEISEEERRRQEILEQFMRLRKKD